MNHKANGVTGRLDLLTKDTLFVLGGAFVVLVIWWFVRIVIVVGVFLKGAREVVGGGETAPTRLLPFYSKEEVSGSYKGREVVIGVVYSGLQGEFLPLPYIRMRLKEAVGYNTNRLPHYAVIEKKFLLYQTKLSVLWGVFDKNFKHVFSKNHLIIALERLLATAEDVERGRTIKEIFK
jgi:hypothetical protein